MKTLFLAAAVAALSTAATAQIAMPPASPGIELTQQVGNATATLSYARPGVKGRDIFGGLITYNKIWRTGANASTKLGFDRDMTFGGQELPAGTYALYTIPGQRNWTVILSKNLNLWGAGGYSDVDDLLRVEVPVTRLTDPVESFTIDFQDFRMTGADLVLSWDTVSVAVPVVDVAAEREVEAQVKEKVVDAEDSASFQDLFTAATFYHQTGRDLETAARWMDKAVSMNPQAFWMVLARGELARDMGDRALARERAEMARKLAANNPGGDYGYVAKSELLLASLESDGAGRGR